MNKKSGIVCCVALRTDLNQKVLLRANGAMQNAKFMMDMIHLLGIEGFFLVSHKLPNDLISINSKDYPAYTVDEIEEKIDRLDLVLEGNLVIPINNREKLRERFSCKFVTIHYGNIMVMNIEEIFLRRNLSGIIFVPGTDEVWTSPHYEKSVQYLETIYKTPVKICPYIWEPDFVDGLFCADDYKKERSIYVMEPNFNVTKTALIPMAIIERVYQRDRNLFDKAYILNGLAWRENEYFLNNMVRNMECLQSKSNKVFFTGRANFDEAFSKPDVLITHQWENELNYIYLEALYKGIPLVHNSPRLHDVGYYYKGFDVEDGAVQAERALTDWPSDADLGLGREFLYRYSIRNEKNMQEYNQLLSELVCG